MRIHTNSVPIMIFNMLKSVGLFMLVGLLLVDLLQEEARLHITKLPRRFDQQECSSSIWWLCQISWTQIETSTSPIGQQLTLLSPTRKDEIFNDLWLWTETHWNLRSISHHSMEQTNGYHGEKTVVDACEQYSQVDSDRVVSVCADVLLLKIKKSTMSSSFVAYRVADDACAQN